MKRGLIGLAAAGAVLAAAVPASGKIIEGRSIAGVKLGATQAQVRARLGRTKEAMRCGRGCVTWAYDAPFRGVIGFKRGKVTGMWTASPRQKTRRGIGKGSSEAAVRRAYRNARCGAGPLGPDSRLCTIRGRYRGRVVITAFPFNTAREGVREVQVYFATRADLR